MVGFSCFTTVDFSPLEEQPYYKESKGLLNQINLSNKDTSWVKAGWATENITPDFPAKIVGFGKNTDFSGVMDSLFVRSIVFEQGTKKYLYLSFDLMIVHPYLVRAIEDKFNKNGLTFEGIYYTATHTHNGLGGYGDKLSGMIALGGIDDEIMDLFTSKTLQCVLKAISKSSSVSYKYGVIQTENLVKNRIEKENGRVDANIRLLQLKNQELERMSLVTFSAHPTCLPRRFDSLSADYPGELVRLLELDKRIDMAIFSAGGVGSHGPPLSIFDKTHKDQFAADVYNKAIELVSNDSFTPLRNISFAKTSLSLRSPHLKIWKNIRLRPWLFTAVMGEGVAKLQFMKLNDVVFVGTPCDFSGELALEIEDEMKNKHIKPVITSFNGEYMGYITPDKYYHRDTHEVRDVNWFGPYNGRYFKESILDVLDKIKE